MRDEKENKANGKIEALQWGLVVVAIVGILIFLHY
jgi:hypothetical protein